MRLGTFYNRWATQKEFKELDAEFRQLHQAYDTKKRLLEQLKQQQITITEFRKQFTALLDIDETLTALQQKLIEKVPFSADDKARLQQDVAQMISLAARQDTIFRKRSASNWLPELSPLVKQEYDILTTGEALISRRRFIKAGIAAGALAGAVGAAALLKTPIKSYRIIVQQGLPQELKDLGFTIGKYTDKGSQQEVLFIAERHDTPREKHAKLIDYLIANYNADSLGLESIYGAPSKDISEITGAKFEALGRRLDPSGIFLKRAKYGTFEATALRKFVHQESIPCYGTEDEITFNKNAVILSLANNIMKAGQSMIKGEQTYDELCSRAPPVRKLEQLYENIKREYPGEIPEYSMGDLLTNHRKALVELANKAIYEEGVTERNKHFARNIVHNMSILNSKRGIVLIGGSHIKQKGILVNTQDLVPYSSLIIIGPDGLD